MLTTLALAVSAAAATAAEPIRAERQGDRVDISIGQDVKLGFLLEGDWLLGLNMATVGGVNLKSPDTVQRPIIAQEFGEGRMIWPLLRFKDVRVEDGKALIETELLGTTDERAYRAVFVYAADRKKALAEGMTPQLRELQGRSAAAEKILDEAMAGDAQVQELQKQIAEKQAAADDAKQPAAQRGKLRKQAETLQGRLTALKREIRPKVAAGKPELAAALAEINAFEDALASRAMELGDIHRDYYRFAMMRQPEEICSIEAVKKLAAELKDTAKPAGTLTWILEPQTLNIAGWEWRGWKQSYRFALYEGKQVNAIRQAGTWELDGSADGLTVVNLRYRGLGRIEQKLTADDNGRVKEAWTTTEIMPGAVGGAPIVSPVVPASTSVNDRGYALRHRVGAWICRMARGAGHGFVDFQYRPHAALASFFEKQGNLRALSEVMPGDRFISQTDEEIFALTDKHETQSQVYVALVNRDRPLAIHELRTRWQEVDQYVRDIVSDELGFVQFEPLPGVGLLYDGGWAGAYTGLAKSGVDRYADAGVRLIAVHNPGWVNGRYQGPKGDASTPPRTGGGVCSIYDWWPTTDMEEPWKAFTKACAKRGVAYYPWLGQTIWKDAPFAKKVGDEPRYWSLNTPLDEVGPGYEPEHIKGNFLNARFREVYLGQLDALFKDYGYQGFWVDSFQNLFMSQLDWAGGAEGGARGNSMQRAYWEQIARWSRQGVGWMGESHSFPGMSCSIEVPGWEEDYWYFGHVWKWLRGDSQRAYKPDELDRLCFRLMANKAWLAPDQQVAVILSFKRLAHEYLAALPQMRRPYILDGEKGVLWLPYGGNGQGVWFAFSAGALPDGVMATPIVEKDGAALASVEAQHTYRVSADDLLKRFGVRAGPLADPRIGRKYEMPAYVWPKWAKE